MFVKSPDDGGIKVLGGLAPADLYVPAVWLVWLFVTLIFGDAVPHDEQTFILLKLGFTIVVVLGASLVATRLSLSLRYQIRMWILVIPLALGHDVMAKMMIMLGRPTYDFILADIDRILFGGHVGEWSQAIAWPPLVEYLQIVYMSYFIVAFPLGYVFLKQNNYELLNRYITAMTICLPSILVFYVIIPARTPETMWLTFGDQSPVVFDGPIQGLWLTESIRGWFSGVTSNIYDAYPSGHVTMVLVPLVFAFRFHKKAFAISAPILLSIMVSTLILRYHYLIDVVAAFVFVGSVLVIEEGVHRLKKRRLVPLREEHDEADRELVARSP